MTKELFKKIGLIIATALISIVFICGNVFAVENQISNANQLVDMKQIVASDAIKMTPDNQLSDSGACTLKISADKSTVTRGDTVAITLSVSDIPSDGITAFTSMIKCDEEVFTITQTDIENGGWSKLVVAPEMLSYTTTGYEATTTAGDVALVKFKVSDTAKLGDYDIVFSDSSFSGENSSSYACADQTIKITISDSATDPNPDENNTSVDNNTSVGGNTSMNNNTSTGGNTPIGGSNGGSSTGSSTGSYTTGTSKGANSATSIIPKTGLGNFLLIGIVVTALAAGAFYIKYKKSY